jgi:hypothetical protein
VEEEAVDLMVGRKQREGKAGKERKRGREEAIEDQV